MAVATGFEAVKSETHKIGVFLQVWCKVNDRHNFGDGDLQR